MGEGRAFPAQWHGSEGLTAPSCGPGSAADLWFVSAEFRASSSEAWQAGWGVMGRGLMRRVTSKPCGAVRQERKRSWALTLSRPPSLSPAILACSHGAVQGHYSKDTHRPQSQPSGSFQPASGPVFTLPASKHMPALLPLPEQFAYMPGVFPTGKVPRAAGQVGTARPRAES